MVRKSSRWGSDGAIMLILCFLQYSSQADTLVVLKFSKFSGGACPRTPLVSRDFVAPNGRSRAHIANILNYATPGLTNKKRLGTPLTMLHIVERDGQTNATCWIQHLGSRALGPILVCLKDGPRSMDCEEVFRRSCCA